MAGKKSGKYIQCLFMELGSERCRDGVSWITDWDMQSELHYPDSKHQSQMPGPEVASRASNRVHHARQEWLVSFQVHSRVNAEGCFQSHFPVVCGYSNIEEASCVSPQLGCPAVAWPLC